MLSEKECKGLYMWGGPGTVRMIQLKFFHPKIDAESLMRSYEYDTLAKMQEVFGITDVWATYSWGFSDKTEEEDRSFLSDRVDNFKKLGLRLHAYIQGTNVVYAGFPDKNWYSKDEYGRPVVYHRGRLVTCLNNPEFREYVLDKVRGMRELGFDGVFMDNVQMGQLGLVFSAAEFPAAFTGCACRYCNGLFRERTDEYVPKDLKHVGLVEEYLKFRTESTTDFVRTVSQETRAGGMLFGTNSFDPHFDTATVFGTDLEEIKKHQDYMLFENHSMPGKNGGRGNHLLSGEVWKKPVFVVSYRRGIGREHAYRQSDFDHIYSEAAAAKFNPCIKGSECLTGGVWHNLQPEDYSRPTTTLTVLNSKGKKRRHFVSRTRPARMILKRWYNPLARAYFEKKIIRRLLDPLYFRSVR
jgi:hypothetical protein